MKKITVIILALMLTLSLTACNANPSGGESSSGESSNASPETSSFSVQNDGLITYVNIGAYAPVSYIKDGKQLLTGEVGAWHGPIENWIKGAPKADTLKKISTEEMYSAGSKERQNMMDFIASNGDWEFFPVKVRYEKYTLENQPD